MVQKLLHISQIWSARLQSAPTGFWVIEITRLINLSSLGVPRE